MLVFAAGFFSSAETAVIAANRMRLRHLAAAGNRRAAQVLSFLEKPDSFLTSVLFGNNVSLVVATSLLTVVAQRHAGEAAGVAAAAVAMTVLLTLFSEIIPKSLVLEDADYFAMALARITAVLEKAFRPVVWVVNVFAGGLLGFVRVRAERLPFATREELRAILTARVPRTRTEVMQRRMIRRIFNFGETTAERRPTSSRPWGGAASRNILSIKVTARTLSASSSRGTSSHPPRRPLSRLSFGRLCSSPRRRASRPSFRVCVPAAWIWPSCTTPGVAPSAY
jgi:CBS domain containing-hemolysin-like protein